MRLQATTGVDCGCWISLVVMGVAVSGLEHVVPKGRSLRTDGELLVNKMLVVFAALGSFNLALDSYPQSALEKC